MNTDFSDILPSTCQKLLKSVEIYLRSDENKSAQFFETRCIIALLLCKTDIIIYVKINQSKKHPYSAIIMSRATNKSKTTKIATGDIATLTSPQHQYATE